MEASREILWNVNTLGNVVAMYTLLALSLLVGLLGIVRRAELWASGKRDDSYLGHWTTRAKSMLVYVLAQRGVVRERGPALAHTLIYAGFLVLLFTTTMVFIDHDLGFRIYRGDFYLAVTILSDLFGLAVLIGCGIAAHRRFIQKPDLLHNRAGDSMMVSVLALLIVQGFLLEGLRIKVTNDPWALYSPVGYLVAQFFWSVSDRAASGLHFINWWFHTITVFAVVALLPYTKFFHLIASSANLYFKDSGRPNRALRFTGNLEQLMESGTDFSIGAGSIKDYTWKQLLDLDACTSCGRCQNVCPAYLSGKALSPKWLILDTRNHALALHAQGKLGESKFPKPLAQLDGALVQDLYLRTSGVRKEGDAYQAAGSYRAENTLVQNSVKSLGQKAEQLIAGEVMDSDVFWACTTCMACVEACPVGIDHVDQIVENRRNMVLMRGEVPKEAQATLRALESRGNPFGPAEERMKWGAGLDIPVLKPGDSVDYLYWVGCVSAYDQRKQKIARAVVKLMQAAGLSFGVLGKAEKCSGDPARRLGEENLFQALAKANIETLRSVSFKTVVTNCPHCFHVLKNEYQSLGLIAEDRQFEVIHHSMLLQSLAAQGRFKLKEGQREVTFHDPCYLGRYNREFDAPRGALTSIPGLKILEMEKSREKGMCCGAGGGHFWMDMKVGERVNVLRTNQAAETGTGEIATACPFCMQMLEDGVKLTDREADLQVRDIAEILVEQLA